MVMITVCDVGPNFSTGLDLLFSFVWLFSIHQCLWFARKGVVIDCKCKTLKMLKKLTNKKKVINKAKVLNYRIAVFFRLGPMFQCTESIVI